MTKKIRAIVVGGGIGGLSCVHRMQKMAKERELDLDIKLFEACSRFGGVIESQKKDGFLHEKGPDCFISEKPAGLRLVKELGLEEQLLETRTEFRRSFILHRGRLHSIPEGFYLMAPTAPWPFIKSPLMTWPGKIRAGCELFIPKRKSNEDETLGSFVKRRFGQELLDRMAQPLVAGIYSADPEELSLQATMPRFIQMEQKYGSVTRGLLNTLRARASGPRYSLFLSFKEGMETLVQELLKRIPSSSLYSNTSIQSFARNPSGTWMVKLDNGQIHETDWLTLALPAHQTAQLIQSESPEMASILNGISYSTSITINFGFKTSQLDHVPNGMGFVIPQLEKRNLLACSFSHQKFEQRAPENTVLLRAFMGGKPLHELMERSKEEIIPTVESELRKILGIQGPPLCVSFAKWKSCMPQYPLGHLQTMDHLDRLKKEFKGLFLVGNGYRGVGVPDVIESANQAAQEAFDLIR